MSSRAANLSILLILLIELGSGVGSLLAGSPGGQWVFWIHRAGGLALLFLFWWKTRIVIQAYRRRGVTITSMLSVLFTIVFLGSFGTGVLWAVVDFPGIRLPMIGGLTGLGVHIGLSLLLIPLLLVHAVTRWPRLRRPDLTGRRALLRYAGLLTAGAVL